MNSKSICCKSGTNLGLLLVTGGEYVRLTLDKVSLIPWYTKSFNLYSLENLTSNFEGCTFTSTKNGSISILTIAIGKRLSIR